jgi:serine-type D-Ala-D-Ala carboxypeptidase
MLSDVLQPSQSIDQDNSIRFGRLSILYAASRQDADKPDVGIWLLEQLLGWPEKEIAFHIWYLKGKDWIYRTDTGGYAISVKGAEMIEEEKSNLCAGRLITENKQRVDQSAAEHVILPSGQLYRQKKIAGMKRVDRLMRQGVSDRIFPGGVLLVSREDRIEFFEAYGQADLFSGEPATRETIYDLASLTKPLATTLAVMQLVRQSCLCLDQPVTSVLPRFLDPLMPQVTLRHLLAHSSGLADYRPFFLNLQHFPLKARKEELGKLICRERLIGVPGSQVRYSDLGFMILRWIVESISGQRLDLYLSQNVYHPLGLDRLFFIDLAQQVRPDNIAATELCNWRNILLRGKVHDDNAFVTGGIDGHAGLFGSAADVAGLISVLISDFKGQNGQSFFRTDLMREFWSRQIPSGRALGFDMPSDEGASCGLFFPKNSVGHLGYTGTSFWIDPEQSIFVVLLTNRVHPSRYNIGIRRFRPLIHDEIMMALKRGCVHMPSNN